MHAFNNLRLYVRSGANRPLLEIYVDSLIIIFYRRFIYAACFNLWLSKVGHY
jgi:hypothetical protein